MVVDGAWTVQARVDAVAALLGDPAVLARVLPGAATLTPTGAGAYAGTWRIALGPLGTVTFPLAVTVLDAEAPERLTMALDADGPLGHVGGTTEITLTPLAGGATAVTCRTTLAFGGRLAAFGPSLVEAAAEPMVRQGLRALEAEMAVRLGTPGSAVGGPLPDPHRT